MHSIVTAITSRTITQPESATTTPDPDAEQGDAARAFAAVWDWFAGLLPGGNLTLVALVVGIGWMANESSKRRKTKAESDATNEAIEAVFKAAGRGLKRLGLFVIGREIRGERRSDAGLFKAGRRDLTPEGQVDVAKMESIALAPPKVSLVKNSRRQPHPWARAAARWIESYDRWGSRALDRAVSALLWAVWAAGKTTRAVRAAYGVVAPPVRRLVRVLGLWRRWPYALRGLARLAVVAALIGLYVPAWRGWTVLGMVAALALLVAVSALWQPPRPGDDEVYGPRLWAILAADLKLPEDAVREEWLKLPERLAAEDARVVLRLPWTFRGSEIERQQITDLLNVRLPGEWVGRYTFRSEHPTATYTHKPPPKAPAPEPEPPAAVDIWDPAIQDVLHGLGPDEFLLGVDENHQPLIQKMSDEQSHWALSVGSGGGKSATLQFLAVQMVMKRGTIIPIDPKTISLTPLVKTEGVHPYIDPANPQDMRAAILWVAEVVKARNYEKETGTRTSFEPLYVFLEECNELADLLKEEYAANKKSDAPAGDPIWREGVARILRLGREINVHIIAVFQDFKDNQFGGVSLSPLLPLKLMGSYSKNQWNRIIGSNAPMPNPVRKAGRMVLVTADGEVSRIQIPYAPQDPNKSKEANQKAAYERLSAYYGELRERHGYSTDGLYTAPPAPSPRVRPALLQAASRDEGPEGAQAGSEGGLSEETAGQVSRNGASVTLADGTVTDSRDRLRLIPGQAGRDGQEAAQDLTAPPELLSLAEIARRLEGEAGIPKAETMRAHKSRRDDFPQATKKDGKDFYMESQIRAYYQVQEKNA